MATYDALRSLGEAVLEMMRERCPRAELELGSDAAFAPVSCAALSGTDKLAEGFHLCLWRTAVSGMPRHLPPRRRADGTLMRPPLPLDLHYLLLPVAADAAKQARMLGWALRFMHDLPTLGGAAINRYARGSSAFGADESVEFIADALPVPDHLSLWDRLKAGFQPHMAYVARMVLIESDQAEAVGVPVRQRDFDVGRREEPR